MHRPPVRTAVLSLALPLAAGSLLTVGSMLGDRFWVGRAGGDALAGLGAAHAVWMLLHTLALGLAMGVLTGVARAVGARRLADARRTVGQGVLLGLALGAFAIASAGLAAPLLGALGLESRVAGPAGTYLAITMAGLLLQAPLLVVVFALQGAGAKGAAVRVGAVFPILNLLFDPLLIHVAGLGLPGAAWATLAANAVALSLGLVALRREGLAPGRGDLSPDRAVLRGVLGIGAPGSAEHAVRNVAGVALVACVAPFGAAVLSAYTAGLTLLLVLIFPGLAIGQATAALVGQRLGAGDRERARQTAWAGAGLGAGLLGVAGLALALGGGTWIAIFDATPEAVAVGTQFLWLLLPALPFLGLTLVLGKVFAAARQPLTALRAAVAAHLGLQLPLVFLFAGAFGPAGAFAGMSIAFAAQGLLLARLFARAFPAPAAARPPTERRRLPAAAVVLAVVAVTLSLGGCRAVDFTEKEQLGDPVMELDDGPAHVHFNQKCFYSREGSAGGIGSSAGGGCGCY